jgi:CheY-like chemotaxis protein
MGSRIVVIEDNAANVALMTYLLNAVGHITIVARDGEEGVEVALRTSPDLVLCDLALPKLDGRGVARRLRAEPSLKGVPLIAVTAADMRRTDCEVVAEVENHLQVLSGRDGRR